MSTTRLRFSDDRRRLPLSPAVSPAHSLVPGTGVKGRGERLDEAGWTRSPSQPRAPCAKCWVFVLVVGIEKDNFTKLIK